MLKHFRIRALAAGILGSVMLYGGHALQLCLKRGWVRHLFTVYRREASAPA